MVPSGSEVVHRLLRQISRVGSWGAAPPVCPLHLASVGKRVEHIARDSDPGCRLRPLGSLDENPHCCPVLVMETSSWDEEMQLGEFPLWLSGLRPSDVSVRMRVRSLALRSGLGIRHCHKLQRWSQRCLGTSVAMAVV